MDHPAERTPSYRRNSRERRREPRDPVAGDVRILCEDELGREQVFIAQLVDVSVHGARFRTQQKLPLRSPVIFHHVRLGLGGRGTVRYCNWSSLGYEIGVEFRHGTGWHGPTADLQRLGATIDAAEPSPAPQEISKPK